MLVDSIAAGHWRSIRARRFEIGMFDDQIRTKSGITANPKRRTRKGRQDLRRHAPAKRRAARGAPARQHPRRARRRNKPRQLTQLGSFRRLDATLNLPHLARRRILAHSTIAAGCRPLGMENDDSAPVMMLAGMEDANQCRWS
jgi:hypothetical protein